MTEQQLHALIDELEAKNLPREERAAEIERICDEYIERTGRRPSVSALSRMTNIFLREELTDKTPWKTANTEYPIINKWRLRRIAANETELKPHMYIDADGRRQGKPHRRKRTKYENAYVDRMYGKQKRKQP